MDRIQKALLEYLRYDAPVADAIVPPLSPEEWALLAAEARSHGVDPLLHYKLQRRVPPPEIPAPVLFDLQKAYFINGVANRRRFQYLGDALRALTAAGIPVVVLKGAYLAEAVYPNIALRTMGDVDLLVKQSDLPKAVTALPKAGFVPQERYLEAPADANEFHFIHRASKAKIDLHWEIINRKFPFLLRAEDVFSRTMAARSGGVDVLALSPEDQLVYLSVHAAMHGFRMGLKALCDAAEICAKLPLDWELLIERAFVAGAVRPAWLLLALTRRLLGGEIPGTGLSSLSQGGGDEKHFIAVQKEFFVDAQARERTNLKRPREALFIGRSRWADKIRLIRQSAFPSRGKLAGIYAVPPNSPSIWLLYPRWIAGLFKRSAPRLWREWTMQRRGDASAASRKAAAELMDWLVPTSLPAASSAPGRPVPPSKNRP